MNIALDAAASVPATPRADRRTVRHVVRGGGCAAFPLGASDRLTVTDPEGLQPGLLFVLPLAGTAEAALDAQGLPRAELAVALAGAVREDAEAVHRQVAASLPGTGASGAQACLSLFGPEGAPGGVVHLRLRAPALCVLFAPGTPMAPDTQAPPTELHVEIESEGARAGVAPPPLAPPKLDLRVDAATARAYRVAAGDYIQILDVDGRQCSDFLAFDAAALEAGEVVELDAVTTRTLMGSTAPTPGLHSKFFDARQRPMVEVVRDTVGRHDTFMLACSARYYEDMGYPGHVNCTDNFNRVLAPFGIRERAGWPAINFFYNTFVTSNGVIGMDEPWSRPGDYVLLRAMTDLLCASSSCSDDIDPANGWTPTDIQVRVYDKSHVFSKGIAHRMTPDSEPKLTRESGFHPRTSALTRRFEEYRGFWLPSCFSEAGPIAEYWACRERAVVMDLSALRKFEITGPDAEALLQLAVTRDLRKLADGQVVYTAMCFDHGGMIDDGTVFRLGPRNFRWICNDEYCGVWLRDIAVRHGLKAWVRSSTDQLHNLSLQGPRSRDILRELLVTPAHQPRLDELAWMRFTVGRIGDASGPAVVVSRTGYTGELGYEVWCHPGQAVAVWDALLAAGAPHGLTPLGMGALNMLRIEAGLVSAGHDFCDQTDPFEAGIGFTVAASKPAPSIGAEALARRRATPQRKLVGLDLEGNEPVSQGDPVYRGRAQVGIVTSATRSPLLGKTIALARVDVSVGQMGAALEIGKLDGHQKRIAALVVPFPHFDPEKKRVRM